MNTKFLTAVSAVALLAIGPALAADPQRNQESTVRQDAEKAWENVKEDAAKTYENVKEKVTGTDTRKPGFQTATVDSRMTAQGMIGQPVLNNSNERVGTLKDIILDADGNASMVVVADGEFPGIDLKLAAFDYNAIARRNADGDVMMPLTEEMIDRATAFSYNREDADEKVRVIPANGYSVAELLDAQLINEKNETIAQIDNISLRNGAADQLIVSFDKVLGMGGEKAAIGFKEAKIVRTNDGDDLDFQLSASQTAQFEAYKDSTQSN